VGLPIDYDAIFLDGNTEEERFAVYYLKASRLVALESINNVRSFKLGMQAIKSKRRFILPK